MIIVAVGLGIYVKHRASRPSPPPSAPVQAAEEQPAAAAPPQPAPETNSTPAESPNETSAAVSQETEAGAQPEGAKPAPALGDLQFTSTPPGAIVTIDARSSTNWKTPFATRLKPGSHSVAFALEGYRPETRQVVVFAGKKLPLHVTLLPASAFLAVNSDPPGAQISIDDHNTGQFTPSRISVNPGKHRIALRKEGYQPQITETSVAAGEVFDFSPAMAAVPPPPAATAAAPEPTKPAQQEPQQHSPNPFRAIGRFFKGGGDRGVLEVRTNPKGAEIWLGEKQAPSKSPAKLSVAPGTYTLTLRLAGHKPITRAVTVEKGKTLGVDETFEPQ